MDERCCFFFFLRMDWLDILSFFEYDIVVEIYKNLTLIIEMN